MFVCTPKDRAAEEPCARKILSTLATRAYRRPVTDEDVQTLMGFYKAGRAEGNFDAGIQRGLERILAAPSFLFRVEREPRQATASAYRLGDLDLASRLSFFLWGSVPDEELLKTAVRGKLKDPASLEQQVQRMLRDPRSKALVNNFATRWLELSKLAGAVPDTELYSEFDENLRDAMEQETKLFVASQIQEDRPVPELLTANYSFLNERLATHYGIPNVYGNHYPPLHIYRRRARRPAGTGEHSDGDVVWQPHLGRDAWPMGARESARRAAAAAAGRRAGAERRGHGWRAPIASRPDGGAPEESRVCVVSSADGSHRVCAGEFRRRRQVAHRQRRRAH